MNLPDLSQEPKRLVRERSLPCQLESTGTQTSVYVTRVTVRMVIYKGKLLSPRLDIQVPFHGLVYQLQSTGVSARHKATGQCLSWPFRSTIQAATFRPMAW